MPAQEFVVNTRIQLNDANVGDRSGLILNAMQYAWLGLRKTASATELVYTTCGPAVVRCKETATVVLPSAPSSLYLRMTMATGGMATFAYSTDNATFQTVGQPFKVSKGRWVGAQIGLFSVGAGTAANAAPAATTTATAANAATKTSSLDVDYFRVTAP